VNSKTQIELAVRELHLYARKEAINEIPGSRNTDLYALFRCLSLENIVTIFEVTLIMLIILSSLTHCSVLFVRSKDNLLIVSYIDAQLGLECHREPLVSFHLGWCLYTGASSETRLCSRGKMQPRFLFFITLKCSFRHPVPT